jgi:uncharacterized SAM-binding protein YcdF (DUF218 family)
MKARQWSRRIASVAANALAVLGLAVILVSFTPLTSWYGRRLAGPWCDTGGQVLIVLGGSSIGLDIIARDTYWRSVYAVLAERQWHFSKIILSGAGVSDNMRDFLIFQGVPRGIIEMETRSLSTRENALYAKQLLNNVPGRKQLMTSDYHMFRALRAFRRAGADVVPCPVPDALKLADGGWQTRWIAFQEELVESVKIVYYWARGWM